MKIFHPLLVPVFVVSAEGPCRALLTSVSVDNLRLRLVVTYACVCPNIALLHCHVVTLSRCHVFDFHSPKVSGGALLWTPVLTL